MLKNTSRPINSPSALSESLSAAAVTPHKPFPLMLGSQASVLADTLGFLSARDATSISLSTHSLNTAIKSPAFQVLWLQHIQRDYPGSVTQQPSPQAYYEAARRFQDQALDLLLKPFNQIKSYDYSMIKQTVSHFKTSTFRQRAGYLTQWNKDLGLYQLKNADPKNISLQGLTELTPEVMQHLTVINQKTPIIKLAIHYGYLAQLPKALMALLSTCTQLKRLSLRKNQLQSLPENLLQTCAQLETLDLSYNQLQSLPENLLQTCAQLETLDLVYNQLQSLPETLLQACTQLDVLELSDNQLQSLPENLLQTCTQMQQLSLNHNQLQSLPENLLQTCNQLQQLDLNHNQLQSLPENLLQTCNQLQQLDLNHNQLQSLPENLLQACTQLQILWMNHNQLQSLPENLLQTCNQLKRLDLNHNQLQSLPEPLLQTCNQLKELDLNHNQLQSLPEPLLQACTQMQLLFLNHNRLQSLPETLLQACTQLDVLELSDNQLQSLPETLLQACTQLKLLVLNHNHLITVTRNNFSHLPNSCTLFIDSQTPVGASSSSAISPEQKTAENEDEPRQKKVKYQA